jgi:hypothetical protein
MNFEKLLAGWRTKAEAKAYKAFEPTQEEKQTLAHTGGDVLRHLSPTAGACALMSAAFAERLQQSGLRHVYVVAGSLSVRGQLVFGDRLPFDGQKVFSESNSSWNGHAWIMFGPYVADISIFRTAYSQRSPTLLTTHVRQEFGERRGLLMVRWTDAPKSGLRYSPQYILSDNQVAALTSGASAILR